MGKNAMQRDEELDYTDGCPGSDTTICRVPVEEVDVNVPQAAQQYVTLKGAVGIVEKLDRLLEMSKEMDHEELHSLARTLKWEFGRLCSGVQHQSKAKNRVEALQILKEYWCWHTKNLGYDVLHLIKNRCGVPNKDIAVLMGVTETAIIIGMNRYEGKITNQQLLYDGADKSERSEFLMERIYKYIMDPNFPAMDRDKLNAAKAYIEMYNKQLERDTVLTWKQVSMVSDWFFTDLLPTLQQRLQATDASVNIRQVCLELFEKLSGDLKEMSSKINLPPISIVEMANDKDPKRPGKKRGRPVGSGKKR